MKNNKKYIQPYIILGFALWRLISALFMRNPYECPMAADAGLLMEVIVTISLLLYSVARIIHYSLWRKKAKTEPETGEEPVFDTERMQRLDLILLGILGIISFLTFTFLSYGNLAETWQFWVLGGSMIIFFLAISFMARKKLKIKMTIACLVALIALVGIYTTAQLSLKEYESNSKYFLSYSGNPVSVTEFGITGENADEEKPIEKITPFAEHYIFRSRTHKETEDGRKPYIYYYILRSENENIVRKYEKQLLDNMQKYGSEIKEIQSDKWDYLCKEVHEGKEQDCGYAVKGSTVIYLDIISDIAFEEFFDKAYENIFNK